MKIIIVSSIAALCFAGCSSTKSQVENTVPRARQFKQWQAAEYHKEIQLQIGWYDYEEREVESVESNLWVITEPDSGKSGGKVPIIIVSYPDSSKTMTLGMDIDNELLGKLLKHSLMTEIPIQRPFADFLQESDCATCHPAEIKIRN